MSSAELDKNRKEKRNTSCKVNRSLGTCSAMFFLKRKLF